MTIRDDNAGGEVAVEYAYSFAKVADDPDAPFSFVLGPVLVPDKIDRQGDVIDRATIEKSAHEFLIDSRQPGFMHEIMLGSQDAAIVESYILRKSVKINGRTLPAGTWMLGTRVYNQQIRKLIREGKITGYSIGGAGKASEEYLEADET